MLSSYVNPTLEDEHSLQAEAEQIEDKWAALETQAIEKALAALPMAELKDINKTLDIVAKRRVGGAMADAAKLAASNPKIQLVTLRLPETQQRAIIDAQAEVVTNSTGEVVRAGNRDLAALSTDGVTELLEFNRPQTSEYSIDPEDL